MMRMMMRPLGGFLLLLALAVPKAGTQRQDMSLRNSTAESSAFVSFPDVWNRSLCQPLEKLISIVSEYPTEVEHVFSPSCVPLHRCSGCCRDERLHCVPTEMANVTMQLVKINSEKQVPYVELSFLEHRKCVCRRRRPRGRSKRKRAKQRLKN